MFKKKIAKILPMRLREVNQNRSRVFLLQTMPKNSVCAEIGVNRGNFSKLILKIVKPKKLYLIDPWTHFSGVKQNEAKSDENYNKTLKRVKNEIESGQVILKKGSSLDVLTEFEDNFFDWIYVDGDHRYEFVKKDLELSYSKVKKNGFITGDDYNNQWGPKKKQVAKAVDEFINKDIVEVVQLKNEQFILKKI